MWISKIVVRHKPGIPDPEGKTIQNVLSQLGYNGIKEVGTGRFFQLEFNNGIDRAKAEGVNKESL